MKHDLTAEQIAQYRRDGFIVIPGFLDGDELEELRGILSECLDQAKNARMPQDDPNLAGKSDDYYSNVFIQRLNLWQRNARMKAFILQENIGKMCCELEGIDAMRVWHDQTLIKRPWDNPTSWHLDNPYWSFDSRHAISIWIALDDATYQNGCLYFLPGTHKLANFENVGIGANMRAIFEVYPDWKNIASVAAPMKAGDCSFHNGLTCHGAGANMTNGWRRAMTCAFMPDGATFNGKKNILTQEQVEKLKVGDPLCDDAQNPIVWSRSTQGS